MKYFKIRRRISHNPRGQQGFSLLELLFAMALLLSISITILPAFINATQNNRAGRDSTRMTGYADVRVEGFRPMAFHNDEFVLPDDVTERVVQEWWLPAEPEPGTTVTQVQMTQDEMAQGGWTEQQYDWLSQTSPWMRTTTIRQYGLADLYDNKQLDNPLDGDTPDAFVQLKEITLVIQSSRGTSQNRDSGRGRELTLRYLKAF